MEREVAWKNYDEASLDELEALAVDYIDFISENKTERECAAAALAAAEDIPKLVHRRADPPQQHTKNGIGKAAHVILLAL